GRLPHNARKPTLQIVYKGKLGKEEAVAVVAKEFGHVIETVVGPDSNAGFTLRWPTDVTFDANGILYISDGLFTGINNRRIFKLNPNKKDDKLIVVAGNGNVPDLRSRDANWWPDAKNNGLTAADTALAEVTGIAVDKTTGTLYFADYTESCIWKIDSGSTRMFPAAGWCGYGGGGFFVWEYIDDEFSVHPYLPLANPHSVAVYQGGFYFIDDVGAVCRVKQGKLTIEAGSRHGSGGDGDQAVNVKLTNPQRIVVADSGDFYFSEGGGYRIRKVSNGIITTLAGDGTSGHSGDGGLAVAARIKFPNGLALDTNDDLYFVDSGYYFTDSRSEGRIRVIDTDGIITTFAGNGTGSDGGLVERADFYFPDGIAFSPDGKLYIADEHNKRVRRIRWDLPSD
ncbi:MAG: hypothetical protein GY862_29245, partial [Gammaproteobacteria bacterium]|nr:hypothetical protein [Gammaproteobacteria bacterium]